MCCYLVNKFFCGLGRSGSMRLIFKDALHDLKKYSEKECYQYVLIK
jgi:hypothetical protein